MTTKVVKGSLWTLGGQILPLFATLISTPFVIRFLGSEGYGVLILVGLIPMYFSFADFGMSMASTKFGSEAFGQGLRQKEGEVIRTAAVVAFLSSLIFLLPIFVFSGLIIARLSVPEYLRQDGSLALKLTVISFFFGILGSIFNTAQLSRLRMDLNSTINASGRLLSAILAPIVLYLGGGIVGAATIGLAISLLTVAAHITVSGRLLREIYEFSINNSLIKPLIKFGAGLLASTLALSLLGNLEKLVLSAIVSVKFLAYYSIAFTFANMATLFTTAMMQSLIPAFSQLLTPDKKSEFNMLYSRSIRLNIIVLLPALMILFVIAKPFFTVWAGLEFGENSTAPFYVLLFGLMFNVLAYVPYAALTASGRTDIAAKLFWIEILPFTVAVFIFVNTFGILGAAVAWSVRVIIDAILLLHLAKRTVGVTFRLSVYLGNLAAALLFLLPAIIFAGIYDNFSYWLLLITPVCLVAYAAVVWQRLIDIDEKRWIAAHLSLVF